MSKVEVGGQTAEVRPSGLGSLYLGNLTSDLRNGYNGLVPDVRPFRLTESVKAAG